MPLQATSGAASYDAFGGGVAVVPNYIEDVFSTWLYTGNGSSQVIENGINLGSSNSGGSAYFDGVGDRLEGPTNNAAFQFGTGDFTVECWIYQTATNDFPSVLEIDNHVNAGGILFYARTTSTGEIGAYNGTTGFLGTVSGLALNAWNHVAWVRSGGTFKIYLNGVGNAGVAFTTNLNVSSTVNIGSNRTLTPGYDLQGNISNLRLVKGTAVYTSNFTPPSAPLTAISGTSFLICQGPSPFVDKSTNGFAVTVSGNTTSKEFGPFTSATAGKGGLVWFKKRSAADQHVLQDTVRGIGTYLSSNTTDSEGNTGGTLIGSFNSNGFSLASGQTWVNASAATYASWTFREQPKFFDVVTWTGTGANRTVAHNLGSVPGCIIVKRTDTASNWQVYHRSLANTQYMVLNSTDAVATGATRWNSTTPTDTVFSLGTDATVNASGGTYVAYIYAHDAGGFGLTGTDNVISCGITPGFGGRVSLGYEPQWILLKDTAEAGNWIVFDNMRGWPVGNTGGQRVLFPNTSGAETTQSIGCNIDATGFTFDANNQFIYIAIRRGPMRTPTTGTSVFSPVARTGTEAVANINVGFPADLAIVDGRTKVANTTSANWEDRLRGSNLFIESASTAAERTASGSVSFDSNVGVNLGNDGGIWGFNRSNETYINWLFRRAPGFFDVVCYTGTGSARTANHNLGVVPEMMIVKRRSSSGSDWWVYNAPRGATKSLRFTDEAEFTLLNIWNNTDPTSSVFTVGGDSAVNGGGSTYVNYLFASCPGVSRVGSYTGNGSNQTINCGFTGGARFVLIKRTDASGGDWLVFDTARGMTSGNDPVLKLNNTDAEASFLNTVDTVSTGFTVYQNAYAANASGGTYIFLAIA